MKVMSRLTWLLMLLSLSACGDFKYKGNGADHYFLEAQQVQLAQAGARGDIAEIKRLVRNGVDINYAGRDGFTVLYWTMLADQPEALKQLLALGADANQRVFDNVEPPVTTAALYKNPKFLRILLDHGVDVESTRGKSSSVLRESAKFGRLENVKFLVSRCANINRADHAGAIAAVQGLASDSYEIAYYLLEQGADYNLHRVASYLIQVGRPSDPDKKAHYDAIKAILIERGIDVDGIAAGRVERPTDLPESTPVYGKDCKNPPTNTQ